ncbi:helix-turn-helix domain-containing protein [Paenibacillus marchantiophytorum]|nr:helix-turn-helix domain-containing protein [Paenibacillus marchantiophytorum]
MSFKLREIELFRNHAIAWELRLQFIKSYTLILAASGQGWLTIDGRFIELRQGSAYICAPGQLIQAAAHSFDERGFYHLRFDMIEEAEAFGHPTEIIRQISVFPIKGEVITSSPVSVNALCETIYHELSGGDPLKRFRSQILFQEVLYTILQDALLNQGNDPESALESTKAYIERHYQQDLTIEQLAKVAGMSSRHFMRLFKKRYGCSAIDYLTDFRIKQAQQLMRTGEHYRLKDIARHVGYHDDIYFRRKFKQIAGMPPATFMKNSKLKIVAYDSLCIGYLLTLKITPSAAPADHPWTDYYQRKYATEAVVPLSSDFVRKREEIRLVNPDYIVGLDIHVPAEEQTRLQEIAPTFVVPWTETDWRKQLRLIAQFLGLTAIAEVWLENYERKAHLVSAQVKSLLKDDSLLILRITGNQYHVLGSRSIATVFYDDLQIVPAPGVDPIKMNQQVIPEQLPGFDADRLLLIVDEDPLAQSTWHKLTHSKLWHNLKAVRNGRVDFLPTYPWVEYTAFTQELLLNEVQKLWRNRA